MGVLKNLIEIPAFLTLFSTLMIGSISTNLIIYRTCYVTLNYTESECEKLGGDNADNFTQNLEKLVEPYANTLSLIMQTPFGVLCTVVALFLGSWSDRNGRKPILIFTMVGQAICFGMIAAFCCLPNLSPWYLFVAMIPASITGGLAATLTAVLSYLTEVSSESKRGMRLGVFEVTFALASLIGTLSSSYIYKLLGYAGTYSVATGFTVLSIIFTIFILEESLPQITIEMGSKLDVSFTKQLKDMAYTALRKRPNNQRCFILLCICITSLFIFSFASDAGISYLFLRAKFTWTFEQYTIFSSIRDGLSIIGTFLGIYCLHKLLKVNEIILILIGLTSCTISSLIQGVAAIDMHIYIAGLFRIFSGCVSPMVRSLISKTAKPDEIGKIFSVAVMFQSILQLIGSPFFTEIYNKSLSTWPSLYNFITAGIYFFTIILTIILMIMGNRSRGSSFEILNEDGITSSPGSINDDQNGVIS